MAYFLPCPQCGRKLVVTTGQAGGQARCECGVAVEVPTVRGLRELEPVADAATERATSWSARHSVIFLGALVAIAGLTFGLVQYFRAADRAPDVTFSDDIRAMPPAETWTLWSQFFQRGIGNWQPKKDDEQQFDLRASEEMRRWAMIGFGIAGVGVVIAIVGFTMSGPNRRVPPKRPPRRDTAKH